MSLRLLNIEEVLERLMYNCWYNFLEMNSDIYNLQFGFRQKCSTSYALINLTNKIWDQLGSGQFACGIFVDLQRAFDTVDHDILIQKLNHNGIREVVKNWLLFYLQNRFQYVSINSFSSSLECILCCPNSVKRNSKQVNQDLENLTNWLNASKTCLNTSKTEVVLFISARKHTSVPIKLKLHRKRLYSNSVKYLRVKFNESLISKQQISNLAIKLKVVSTTFLPVRFVSLKESTCETMTRVFSFTLKALFVLEIILF